MSTAGETTISPVARIDHAALRHNLLQVRRAAPDSRVWAVVKSNAYGHGIEQCARSLTADGFALARLEEAVQLRNLGVEQPLLVMSGVTDPADFQVAAARDIELALHADHQLDWLLQARPEKPLKIWLKVNTGMNRLGLSLQRAQYWLKALCAHPNLRACPGLMTHLADADDLQDPLTQEQCQRLGSIVGAEKLALNIGNSAGILGWPEARTDWVRPGIMLYGVSPFLGESGEQRDLKPVMTLTAPLIAVNQCCKGDRLGYGGAYSCPEDMPVGVIGIGYGDGYPRHAPTGTPVLLNGQHVPLLGRVSMDSILVDLRGIPLPAIGDQAVLWGEGLPAEEIAEASGTIAYELFTGVTERVSRQHLNV